MNWDDLKYFLAVAREGSITGGAKLLNVQHSTVSRRLRALEKDMGTQLIERKKSGYELTDDGELLKQSALKMELEFVKVDGSLIGKETELSGDLRVTAINNMASTILMPIFASFAQKYPLIKLHINVNNTYASLAEREADVAIRLTNSPLDTLIGKRLTTVASTVYGSHSYLETMKKEKKKPKWLGVTCCGFHQAWTKQACEDHQHQFFSDDTLLTLSALKQNVGIAYLPCFMGDSDKQLERVEEPDENLNLGLWLLYHPDLKRNAKISAFRKHMSLEIENQKHLFHGVRNL